MSFFEGFKNGIKGFSSNISIIINTILLLLVYLIGIGITSIIAKIVGKKFLEVKDSNSYWKDLDLKKKDMKEYYRQF